MGELAKYFVPDNQEGVSGRGHEIATALLSLGLRFTVDGGEEHMATYTDTTAPIEIPASKHDFSFADMGIADLSDPIPVPEVLYELLCPNCHADVTEPAHEVWQSESEVAIPDRQVPCPNCGGIVTSTHLESPSEPFTFARFYLWVADIDPEDWEPDFKATLESVVGSCQEFESWET